MSLSKKLEKLIRSSPEILPVKVDRGILVGDVLIDSQGHVKNLYKKDKLIYSNINLNIVAIKLANLLAKNNLLPCDKIYQADQEYGKWFVDSQVLRSNYENAVQQSNYNRADIFWARYIESRDRAAIARDKAERLVKI